MTIETLIPGLNGEDIARTQQPLERAWTLPPNAYTCPDIGAIEQERVLKTSWLPVGRVDQIPEQGDYLCFNLFDQPLMMVRGHDDQIRVMSRVCLHRGAPLAEGKGNSKLFVCPYHAWSYKNDGQLRKAPLMDGAQGFDESQCRLPELRIEIWNGFVLINFDDAGTPFSEQAQKFSDYFANYRLNEVRIVRTLEYDSHWNWKVLVENFMEAYHHIAIHARTFEPMYRARDSRVVDHGEPCSILHMPSAHGYLPEGFPLIQGLESWQETDLIAAVAFPYFLIAAQGNAFVWYQVLPQGHDRLTLKIHICVPEHCADIDGFEQLADGAAEMTSVIHQEDIAANDMVWQGLNAPLAKQGRLSPLEKSIWQLNQWWIAKMQSSRG